MQPDGYEWKPKEDVTIEELAEIFFKTFAGGATKQFYDRLSDNAKRHLVKPETEMCPNCHRAYLKLIVNFRLDSEKEILPVCETCTSHFRDKKLGWQIVPI